MCEFCSLPNKGGNRDAFHSDFAGFFSAEAIDAAVRQAKANSKKNEKQQQGDDNNESSEETGGVDDDDGT
jgi:hypothetical protein